MSDISTAGPILKDARARAGLSQRALARRAHTTQAVVARIEAGISDPSFTTLSRLLRAVSLELTIDAAGPPDADPVIEAYKSGIDRTLLIENLRSSVEKRLRINAEALLFGDELRRAMKVAERKR